MMRKEWLLVVFSVVVVALSISLTPTLALAPQGDPSGVEWHLQKTDKLPYPIPRIEEAKPQVFKPQSEETKPEENDPPVGLVKAEPPAGTQDSKPQAKDQNPNADKPIDYQWWFNFLLVLFNAGLVTIGALQYRVYKKQAYYMEVGLEITRDSADAAQQAAAAAKEAADAATRSVNFAVQMERPRIQVVPGTPKEWPPIGLETQFLCKWAATNIGRSPAFLTRIYATTEVMTFPGPDQQPSYKELSPFAEFAAPSNGKGASLKLRAAVCRTA
jgi:hypothetical protein